MQRHLSTGTTVLSALMAAQHRAEPLPGYRHDILKLLATLGDCGHRNEPVQPATRNEEPSSAGR